MTTTSKHWEDLRARLEQAAIDLDDLADGTPLRERRLHGKAQGVRLALTYMAEYDDEDEGKN